MRDPSAAEHGQRQPNGLDETDGRPARNVAAGERWAFVEHRTLALWPLSGRHEPGDAATD